ncbi:MAG: TetR/AcrR family transcriptional regulator [Acidimicrobiales bacterium]
MVGDRWRRGESRDRLLRATVSGRKVAAAAGVHHPQIQQMFGSVEELVMAALIAERDRFNTEAFRSAALPSPLLVAAFPDFWRAMAQVLLDPGPVDLTRLAEEGPIGQLATRIGGRSVGRHSGEVEAIATAWFAAPLGALIFREPLQRGLGISADEWEQCWERLGRRIADLAEVEELPTGGVVDVDPDLASTPTVAPTGRGRERLLGAATLLLETRLETSVTGRELAAVAGVNYGLVSHYFGSKAAAFDEALSSLHRAFLDDVLGLDDSTSSARSLAVFVRHGAFFRSWAGRLIRGQATPAFELLGMQRLMRLVLGSRSATRGSRLGDEAMGDVVTAISLQLGWTILRPLPAVTEPLSLADVEASLASIHRLILGRPAAAT